MTAYLKHGLSAVIKMQMKQLGAVIVIVLHIQAAGFCVDPVISLKSFLPVGIRLGMTSQEVANARPATTKSDLMQVPKQRDHGAFKLVESASNSENRMAIWYHFEENVLQGVLTTKAYTSKGAFELFKALDAGIAAGVFLQEGGLKIVRTNGFKAFELTATHWKEAVAGVEAYAVVSNRELTIVVFDPTHLSADNFFLDTNQMAKVNANGERIRQMMSEQGQKSFDVQPADIVDIPIPIISARYKQTSAQPSSHVSHPRSLFWPVGFVTAVLFVLLLLLRRRS